MAWLIFLSFYLLVAGRASGVDLNENAVRFQVPLSKSTKRDLGYPEDSLRNFTELAGSNGYQTEEHTITTEDGYILTIFRISSENCTGSKGTPVLLMHGLLESAEVYLVAGPGTGMAYLLADSCYDTWVGNCRGNYYARAHTTLNPDKDAEFWKFSTDEIGYYDTPAHIDYILKHTGFDQLNYVGFSQGGASILINNSERPEYNDKVAVAIALSPAARLLHSKSPILRLLADGILDLHDFLAVEGIDEIFYRGGIVQTLLEALCHLKNVLDLPSEVCKGFIYLVDSFDINDGIAPETVRILYSHFPAGTSVQLLSRFAQALHVPYFQKYDHGSAEENLNHYGSETPPKYNVSKVTTPVVMTYGPNDHLVDPRDVMWLKEQMPNVLEVMRVDHDAWNHLDNVYSTFISTLVYPTVDKYLSKYTSK